MLFSVSGAGVAGRGARAGDEPISIREYRDSQPTIDRVDPVRLLSADKAGQLEAEIKSAYAKLAPAVVRIWQHDDQGRAVTAVASGAIITRKGLVLTCSHHGLAPGTPITIELADGKRVAGKILGRFRLDDPKPMHFGPDLGLATISDGVDWPAAAVDDTGQPDGGQVCLTIGYPWTLGPGRPPLLRVGRIIPSAPGWPWVESTTTGMPGDSGGPLFDLRGRILGILVSADTVMKYQSVLPLKAYRDRLEAGEIVSAPKPGIRAMRARPAQPAAFNPALDIEDRVLQTQSSVIRIMDGPHEVASGLIVDEDGWAITKASLVGSRKQWSCRLFFSRDGRMIVKGRIVATSAEHDLALMKLEARAWRMVHWADRRPAVGTFVSTALGRTAGPLQFAIVGAEASPEPATSLDSPQVPLSVKANAAGAPAVVESEWRSAEFDAYREFFEVGDVITHLNGVATPTFAEYAIALDRLDAPGANGAGANDGAHAPGPFVGDWVRVGIRRGGVDSTVQIPRIHSAVAGALDWHSDPLSLRRESFPAVFAHDFRLRPEQCGGPVVDLSGNVVGLNIARADATRTLAIPADVLRTVIKELRAQAKDAAN